MDSKDLSPDVLATLGGEAMWDAVLASVPGEDAFVPPAPPPPVGADVLAAYAGTYEFAAAPAQVIGPISGLGLEVHLENGLPKVVPVAGGPAAAAGVLAGDVVTELDGSPLQGLALGQVLDRMRGPTGSRAELAVSHKDQGELARITVVRGPVRLRSLLKVQVQEGGLTVEAVGGQRVYEFQNVKPTAVLPSSDAEFFVEGRYHTRIAFTKDATGRVSGAVLNPGRWEQKGVRVG